MSSLKTLFLFCVFFFFFFYDIVFIRVSADNTTCEEASCKPDGLPVVHFPFRLMNQSSSCAYAGQTGRFDLDCNNNSQTVIRLQSGSGHFVVERISYAEQYMWINDPNNCLPRRLLNQEFTNFTSETFRIDDLQNYTFLNCSKDEMTAHYLTPISCLGDGDDDHAVVAVPTSLLLSYGSGTSQQSASYSPAPAPALGCSVIGIAGVPVSLNSFPWTERFAELSESIRLTWSEPDCSACLERGGECGFRNGSTSEIGCSVSQSGSSSGLPRSAKYGIIIGVGIPGLLCVIGLASYICGKLRACGRRHRPNSDHASSDTPQPVVVLMGLDGRTIESFPKIELGESKRLPKPSDNTCPICLSEYQPKETLRTIPECNHYFHANCVDEWLKMNATCPLCRNSPDGSSHVSPSTSVSTSISTSSFSLPSP